LEVQVFNLNLYIMITDMNFKIPAWIIALVVILFLLITCDGQRKLQKSNSQLKLYKVLEDTLVHFKDKNGNLSSKIQILEADNFKQILELKSSKRTLELIQNELKQYKGKATNSVAFSSQTKFDTIIKTEIKYVYDTLFQDGDTILIPLKKYAVHHNDRWINVNFDSDSSNTSISLKVNNEYSVSLVKNKKKYEAIVKNYNPYSSITEVTATSLVGVPKKKRFGIGLQFGYGINSSFKIQPYLGVGMSCNVVQF